MSEFADIKKLAELFNPSVDNSDSDDEKDENCKTTTKAVNAQNSGETKPEKEKVNPYSKIDSNDIDRKEIFDPDAEDFMYEEQDQRTRSDWKKTPKWDITYKQQVTASDVFLQMGFKSTATASCEDMIIAIHLPGENRQNIELKILKTSLNLVSPRFYLDLKLPHPVDPQKGNAQWEKDSEKLLVTLRLDRELDLVNF